MILYSMLIVGGTFDDNGGKRSKIIDIIHDTIVEELRKDEARGHLDFINGGNFSQIEDLYNKKLEQYNIIFWFPNIPNNKEKLRNIKELCPETILITSKANDGSYDFAQLVNHALKLKSNLVIEFTKNNDVISGRVFDPLGAVWCNTTTDFVKLTEKLYKRTEFLSYIVRYKTTSVGPFEGEIPNEERFFEIVRRYADVFHELIKPAKEVTRFLGNSSFRCRHGFPSFKRDDLIFVSRRNVDKRGIDRGSFVPTYLEKGRPFYYGDHKPSVDTPVQLYLYSYYKNVRYMIHSHVYIEGAPFTKEAIPCGGIEEILSVIGTIRDSDSYNFAVNLIGHGSLVCAQDLDYFDTVSFVSRDIPEVLEHIKCCP